MSDVSEPASIGFINMINIFEYFGWVSIVFEA